MGYKQDGFVLHSSWIVDRDRVGEWTDATFISQRILRPLAQERVLAQLDHVSVMTAPAIPLPSFEALDELVKSGDNQALFMFAGSQDDPDSLVHITITRISVDVGIGTTSSAISPELRERISMWMQSWSLSLAELHRRLSSAVFGPPGKDYPPSSAATTRFLADGSARPLPWQKLARTERRAPASPRDDQDGANTSVRASDKRG
jgi:hypothetical protein